MCQRPWPGTAEGVFRSIVNDSGQTIFEKVHGFNYEQEIIMFQLSYLAKNIFIN